MLKTGALALAAAVAVSLTALPAQAATFLTATPSNACGKAGCFTESRTYRQTFSAADLLSSGAANIRNFGLDRDVLGAAQDWVFKVTFRRADGSLVSDWGGFEIGGLYGDVVTLGGQAFDWTAADGDLVLQIDVIAPSHGGSGLVTGGLAAPAWPSSDRGAEGAGLPAADALPPQFLAGAPGQPAEPTPGAIVPEPSVWALMLVGFGAAGTLLRRRLRAKQFG